MPLDDRLKELTPPEPGSAQPEMGAPALPLSKEWAALLDEARKPLPSVHDLAAESLRIEFRPTIDTAGLETALKEFAAMLPSDTTHTLSGSAPEGPWLKVYFGGESRLKATIRELENSIFNNEMTLAEEKKRIAAYTARPHLARFVREKLLRKSFEKDRYEHALDAVSSLPGRIEGMEEMIASLTEKGYWVESDWQSQTDYAVFPYPAALSARLVLSSREYKTPAFVISVTQDFSLVQSREEAYLMGRALACHVAKHVEDLDIVLDADYIGSSYRVPVASLPVS